MRRFLWKAGHQRCHGRSEFDTVMCVILLVRPVFFMLEVKGDVQAASHYCKIQVARLSGK